MHACTCRNTYAGKSSRDRSNSSLMGSKLSGTPWMWLNVDDTLDICRKSFRRWLKEMAMPLVIDILYNYVMSVWDATSSHINSVSVLDPVYCCEIWWLWLCLSIWDATSSHIIILIFCSVSVLILFIVVKVTEIWWLWLCYESFEHLYNYNSNTHNN